MPTVEQVQQLHQFYRVTIPDDYLDIMGHMNMRWYLGIFGEGAWNLFASLGMTRKYYEANEAGNFALRQVIDYLAEVQVGETVSVYTRMLGRTEKRFHFMNFMINETRHNIAATLEGMGAHADLTIRRTAPFPPHIAENFDALIKQHNALDWDVTLSGAIKF